MRRNGQAKVYLRATKTMGPTSANTILAKIRDEDHRTVVIMIARYAKEIADGALPKVGLNCHRIPDEEDTLLKEVAETKIEPYWDHIEEIRAYKKRRDSEQIKSVLQECNQAARNESENLTHPIMKALEAGATIGEISGSMRMAYNYPYDPHGMVEPLI